MNLLRRAVLLVLAAAAGGCASQPKAPTLNGFGRVPINGQAEVDLQSCKSDLSNTKIMLTEASRLADSATSALAQVGARCTVVRPDPGPSAAQRSLSMSAPSITPTSASILSAQPTSAVFTLLFPYASSTVNLTDEAAINLSTAVRGAQRIVISGRTDGASPTPSDERIARARAEAVQQYLIAQGVPATIIRVNYQSASDYAADNSTAQGRARNRRAEVEVYALKPTEVLLAQRSN